MGWKEEFATGIDEIDQQHRLLFDHAEVFRDVLENGGGTFSYKSFLDFLSAFIEIHFGYEEECMHAHRCPCATENKKEHAIFSRHVANEVARYEQEGFDTAKAFALLTRVETWLEDHIGRIDTQLRACVRQQPPEN